MTDKAEAAKPVEFDAEARLDAMMFAAFDTNHPAMHDYVLLKMELKRCRAALKAQPAPTEAQGNLHAAAAALVARWDTPMWKHATHTAELVDRLRKALSTNPTATTYQPGSIGAQEFLTWNRSQPIPLVAIPMEMGVYRKAIEIHQALQPSGNTGELAKQLDNGLNSEPVLANSSNNSSGSNPPEIEGIKAQGEDSARLDAYRLPPMTPACACKACNQLMIGRMMFICEKCGDKRCPHVTNHLNPCQGRARASAETGGVKS